jgi:hypothetical protein
MDVLSVTSDELGGGGVRPADHPGQGIGAPDWIRWAPGVVGAGSSFSVGGSVVQVPGTREKVENADHAVPIVAGRPTQSRA